MSNFFGYFLLISGHIIGLGAVTVIDLHGFVARHSIYWTVATTRTHKITKPMIWTGIFLAIIGALILYKNEPFDGLIRIQAFLALLLILNGQFLTFSVSPFLIKREKEGLDNQILPKSWQNKITLSFIISVLGWWGSVIILTLKITGHN